MNQGVRRENWLAKGESLSRTRCLEIIPSCLFRPDVPGWSPVSFLPRLLHRLLKPSALGIVDCFLGIWFVMMVAGARRYAWLHICGLFPSMSGSKVECAWHGQKNQGFVLRAQRQLSPVKAQCFSPKSFCWPDITVILGNHIRKMVNRWVQTVAKA